MAAILVWSCLDPARAAENQVLAGNTTWNKAGSPYTIEGELSVPATVRLTIGPGVKVLLGRGASLVITGEIVALGTLDDPIIFTSSAENPGPGDWGNLRFATADTTPAYDETGAYQKGSRLEFCVVEYGGNPAKGTSKEFLGGAIHCRKSSPFLRHLTLRHNRGQFGGGIYCHEFASPYIEDCLFLENAAMQSGGGLACFFYSNAVVKHNVFQANQAGEHGGGIYFSFASPQILDNIIENNNARYQGGGLYGSNTVTKSVSRVRGNVLLSNQAGEGAGNVYLTAKIETIFQENCLFNQRGFDVYVEALESDLDFRGNYFGPLGSGDLESRVRDRYDDPTQKVLICDPVLEVPPANLPNTPSNIASITLAGDAAYTSDWPFPLCPEAPIYLEIRATDTNPYHADWIPVRLRSSESDVKGVVALAWETGPSTGIFRLNGSVEKYSSAKEASVKTAIGEILFFSVEGATGFEITRGVDPSQSYVTAFRLPLEADSLHVVNHQPEADWQFRNIFGSPQMKYELQLSAGSVFSAAPLWSSGEVQDTSARAIIKGVDLTDGNRYALRMHMNSGAGWSDWCNMALRMNSLPTTPELTSPLGDQILAVPHPVLTMQAARDAEGDPIIYEVQLYQDSAFSRVLAIEKELKAAGVSVQWIPAIELKDNAEYFWRGRSRDACEVGPWASTGHFWMNLVEEPPLPFVLMDPQEGLQVYQLQPVFSWHKTVDPDPLSEVHYRLLICPDEKFAPANTSALETDQTFLKVNQILKNDAAFCWKVEAVDNTNRFTPSQKVGHFSVSTTPSVPDLAGPFNGEELRPSDRIIWSKSTDPDPEDALVYRLQITLTDFSKPAFEEIVQSNSIEIDSLQNYSLLADDKEYRARVCAQDDQGIASAWSKTEIHFFMNKVNTVPGAIAGPVTPNGSVEINPQPLLSWGSAADADRSDPPASISYLIQFDRDGSFREIFRQVQVMAGVTHVAIPGLLDNTSWYYRICARDDEGAVSAWCPTRSFILNTKNDPPTPFALTAPEEALKTYHLDGPVLSWQASSDLDPGDKIHYLVYLAPAKGGPALLEGKRSNSTAYAVTANLKNEIEYAWWVEAEDSSGARTASQTKYHFTVNTTPSTPTPAAVEGGILNNKSVLTWTPATDPDPADKLTYTLQVVAPENPETALLEIPKIAASKASGLTLADLRGIRQLPDNHRFAFRVRAVDPHGITSAWGGPTEFTLDAAGEPPARFALVSPPQNQVTTTAPLEFVWDSADDPDPGDAVRYTFLLSKDASFLKDVKTIKDLESPKLELTDSLDPGTVYYWRVLAQDRYGLKVWGYTGENRSGKFTVATPPNTLENTGEIR
jgi:hypothetical protein